MKKLSILFVSFLFIAAFESCDKKSFNEPDPNGAEIIIQENGINIPADLPSLWYIDNQLVTEPDYATSQANQEILFEIITTGIDSLSGKISMINLAFTTREGYIEYGIKHNLILKEELEFSEHMRQYAEETGAIDEYERTGKIPDAFLSYEKAYYEKVFKVPSGNKVAFVLWDEYLYGTNVGVPYFWMLATLGYMNNRTSCVFNGGLGAAMTLFNKTFYRDRLVTLPFIPCGWWPLTGNNNNAAESVITF
jgi:hypothetical protein